MALLTSMRLETGSLALFAGTTISIGTAACATSRRRSGMRAATRRSLPEGMRSIPPPSRPTPGAGQAAPATGNPWVRSGWIRKRPWKRH